MTTFTLYQIDRDVFIPAAARTDAGFFLEMEPVQVLAAPSTGDLAAALAAAAEKGNPRVPTPARGRFPPRVMLKHAKLRSEAELERKARSWSVAIGEDRISLVPYRRAPQGGLVPMMEQELSVVRSEDGLNRVAARILGIDS